MGLDPIIGRTIKKLGCDDKTTNKLFIPMVKTLQELRMLSGRPVSLLIVMNSSNCQQIVKNYQHCQIENKIVKKMLTLSKNFNIVKIVKSVSGHVSSLSSLKGHKSRHMFPNQEVGQSVSQSERVSDKVTY